MAVEVSCNLSLFQPSLTLTAQSIYPGDQGTIQYSIHGLTAPGNSSYYCTYTLAVRDPSSGITIPLQPTSQAQSGITRFYNPQGSFSVNLSNYLSPPGLVSYSSSAAVELELTFSVLKGSSGSASNEAISFLTKSVDFVFSGSNPTNGPIIYVGSTPVVDAAASSNPVTLFGTGFSSSVSLTASSPASITLNSSTSTTINASLNCSSCTGGTIISVTVTAAGISSAPFNILVVDSLSGVSLIASPSAGAHGTTNQSISISSPTTGGYYFGFWTSVSMTDTTRGINIPIQISQMSSNSVAIIADLSGTFATDVTAIIVTNLYDGSSANAAFSIY